MESSKSFGPFTPQEFKRASDWLTENNIEFNHFRDLEAEKRFAENSPENLVNQVELRTQTFLGAVFYVQSQMTIIQEEAFKKTMHLTADEIPERFKIAQIPETTHPERYHNKKAYWSRLLLVSALAYFLAKFLKK